MKMLSSAFVLILSLSFSLAANAAEKMKLNFVNEEITKIIENYSKAANQKFIIDSTVRGKITLLNPTEVTLEEAYNQISMALSINGFAIIKQDDNYIIRNARSAQRDNIQVYTELPPANPQRMVTWVITLKNYSAQDLHQQLRMLTSAYGEISALEKTNQIIIADWSTNIQRVADIIKKVDVVPDPSAVKFATQSKKDRLERMALKAKYPKSGENQPPKFAPPESQEAKENN